MVCLARRSTVILWLIGLIVTLAAPCTRAQPAAAVALPDPHVIEQLLDPTQIIAQVGDLPIMAADLLPSADQMLQAYAGKVPEEAMRAQRALLVKQLLPRKIEVKLVYLDFLRTLPADKRQEILANIDKQVQKQYYEEQAPAAMEQWEVGSLMELDAKLRTFGTSIERQRNEFREQMISRSMITQKVERFPEITHDQLLKHYRNHQSKYDLPARARWEKLTVRFDRFPDKAAAERAIVDMGNQVLGGASFSAVAKRFSQGPDAINGGYHDWTTQGSLVSDVIDQALFSLPVDRLSLILEDKDGYHIVRVLERQEAGRIAFVDAQEEIRDKLQEEERQRQIREYIEQLREKTFVRTVLDP